MFVKTFEYAPPVSETYTEGVTQLLGMDDQIYAGREDGVVDCVGPGAKYSQAIFRQDFDLLENVPIKERIIAMERTTDGGLNEILFLGNEKNITIVQLRNNTSTLNICQNKLLDDSVRVVRETTCANIHNYLVNSLSLSCDGEHLLSADFLRINLWRPARMEKYITLVDLKPQVHSNGISYVINAAKFSPFSDRLFAHGASNGDVMLHDLSIAPLSAQVAVLHDPSTRGIRSASDLCFPTPEMIVARSLNSLTFYDTRNLSAPLRSVELASDPGEQTLLSNSRAVYQTFKICADERYVYTGSCFSTVYATDIKTGSTTEILVGKERLYDIENRIRSITACGQGFACVYMRRIYKYQRE